MNFAKEPMSAMWDIVKGLGIKVYKETMTDNKAPESYILLRADITNSGKYGDGRPIYRKSSNDILLISKGDPDDDGIHSANRKKIEERFAELKVAFSGFNLGYDDASGSLRYAYSLRLNCIGG